MRIRFNKPKISDQLGTTLVIEDGKTYYVGNTISIYGNDGSTIDIGNGGRLGALAFKDTLDGGDLSGLSTTGTGAFVLQDTPIINSPALNGNPTATTQLNSDNSTRVATTAYVKSVINDLINGAPGILDTLGEIATAVQNDETAISGIITSLAGKQPLNANLTAISGLVSAADKLPYFTGSGSASLTTLTSFGRQVIACVDAAALNTLLGSGSGSVTSVAATAPAAGFTISGSPITSTGTFVFALADDLAAVEGLSSTGITARTASNTWATRTLTGTTDQVNISNGDGVSGNPTFSLPQSIATTSSPRFASLGVGLTGSIAATLEARSTSGAQICGSYNASNLWTATTASDGSTTFDAIGLGASFTFSDAVVLNSTLNGNTITTGTGTLTLNSYTLTVSGASAINQDVTTSGTPQFALLGVGTSTVSYQGIRTVVSLSGNATQTGIVSSVTGNSSATTAIRGVYAGVQTAAAAFTCVTASAFWAQAATAGSGSTITNCIGFDADAQTAGSTLNASFRGVNTVASGVWNLYMVGDAANYLAGGLQIGHNGSALGTLESRATSGAQIVGSYNSSNYWTATTSSTGVTTFTPTGSGACFIIAGSILLSGLTSNGFVKTSGGNGMLSVDTSTYLTGNQTITLSGDVSGSGTTTITTTIGAGKVTNAMLAGSITASNLVGTDITTVGTITAGTWNGGTIGVAYGGTGQTSYTDGQLLIGNTTGNTLVKATLTGTANQVVVTNGHGSITLSLPQSIATSSNVVFGTTTVSSLVVNSSVQPITLAQGLAADPNSLQFGHDTLTATTIGTYNVVVGMHAGTAITSGSRNTIFGNVIGYDLLSGNNNVLIGYDVTGVTSKDSNIIIGSSIAAGNNDRQILIGHATIAEGANATVIGSDGQTSAHIFGTLKIGDGSDSSKTATFNCSNISVSTNRVFTLPNASGTLVIGGGTCSGVNTGDQTITLSGDISGSGTGAITTTIGAGKVTNSMLAGSITASNLVGADIATVGTITTGTWHGSVIGITYGGTGQSTAYAALDALTVKGIDIASASTTDLSTATGGFVDITGTTTITSFGAAAAGVERTVRFNGVLTLTHNATSLILPGAANITTTSGDTAIFRSLGSGNWQCVVYTIGSVTPWSGSTGAGTVTLTGDVTGSGTGTISTTIGAGKVTNSMLAGSITASNLVGTDIATVGTITTGIWSATTIATTKGGTGLSSYILGDIVYASATNVLSALAGNTTTTNKFLTQVGTGTDSAAPTWTVITDADIPAALTGKTYNGLTITSTTGTLTVAAGKTLTASNTITFTATDGSTLAIGAGGTLGSAAYTASSAYEVPLTFSTGLTRTTNTITVNTTQNIARLSNLMSNGFVKTSGGDGTLSVDTSTYLTGNETITLSGDISGSGSTAITTTIGAGKVTNTMLAGGISATFQFAALGIGVAAPASGVKSLSAALAQLTTLYDSSNYMTVTTGSSGSTTFALTGTSPTFTFSQNVAIPALSLTTALTIGNGGTGATTAHAAFDALTVNGADIASASTTDLSAATGVYLNITGSTTITSFGTAPAGTIRILNFTGTPVITHNAVSLILPGASNIGASTGDVAEFVSLGSGNWVCTRFSHNVYPYNSQGQVSVTAGKILSSMNSMTLVAVDGSALDIGTGGTLGSAAYTSSAAYEVPLTFSTGLTRTTNTITVNTTQNIARLSNLTSNGFVKTGSANGTLSISTSVSDSEIASALTGKTYNGLTITSTTGTLTVAAGKTLTASNTITFTATDGSTLAIGTGGTLGSAAYTSSAAYEVPLTFSTGLTRTTNTITVNTTQNIATLSNLTSNGFVKTSGGTGTLSVDTSTYLTANQTITLSGDISGSGSTAITTTIGAGKVTNTMLVNSSVTIGTTAISLGSSSTTLAGLTTITAATHIGGTGTTSTLTLQSTSGVGTTGADIIFKVGNNGATEAARITNAADVGIGTGSTVSAQLHVVATTEQLRVGYDASNYLSTTVSSAGVVAYSAVGTAGAFTFTNGTGGSQTVLQITATAATSTAEAIAKFSVSDDANSYLLINNATSTGSAFAPRFQGNQSSNNVALNFTGNGTTDSGTSPLVLFVGQIVGGTAVATRPLVQFWNLATSYVEISAGANLRLQGGSTSPTLVALAADTVSLAPVDSAAGDRNLYARNEEGHSERLTGRSCRNSSGFTATSNTVLANVTGLTRNVEAGGVYGFIVTLYTTSNSAGGVKFAISGTATATSVIYECVVTEGAALKVQTRATTLGTAVGGVTAVTVAYAVITGTIVVNAAGTLTVQFAQNASSSYASTVLTNSTFELITIGA